MTAAALKPPDVKAAKAKAAPPDRLDTLLAAVDILSPTHFQFAGGEVVDAGAVVRAGGAAGWGTIDPADPTGPLLAAMVPFLYRHGYTRVFTGAPDAAPTGHGVPLRPDDAFVAALSAANPTGNRWAPGWRVFLPGANGALNVIKGDTALLAQPGQYAFPAMPGRAPGLGDTVELLVVRDSLGLQHGFYHAFGDTIACDYDHAMIARLYLHTPANEAAWLLGTIGRLLNHHLVPYRLKCLTDPAAYTRTDPMVLYVGRRFLPMVLRLLASVSGELDRRLKPGTPLFAKPLLAGLGVADDPGSGESFGQARIRLVCQGLLDAWRGNPRLIGGPAVTARRAAVAARFVTAGLSLDHPHLAPGMADAYVWPTV